MAHQLILPADWVDLLKLLISRQIEFVISGGVAFSVHARARYTADLDIVVRPTHENVTSFIAAFQEFGFSLKSQDPTQFLKDKKLLRVGVEPSMIDVMNFFEGVPLDELFANKVCVELSNLELPFVSKEHLIANKKAVGRPQDLADIAVLSKVTSQNR